MSTFRVYEHSWEFDRFAKGTLRGEVTIDRVRRQHRTTERQAAIEKGRTLFNIGPGRKVTVGRVYPEELKARHEAARLRREARRAWSPLGTGNL